MFHPGRMTNVNLHELDPIEPSKLPMMPTGLLNSLTAAEIQDLVAYLMSRGDRTHAMYQ